MTQIIISVRESESRYLNRLRLLLPTPGSLPRLRRLRNPEFIFTHLVLLIIADSIVRDFARNHVTTRERP